MKSKYFFYFFLYLIIYIFTLTFIYVEGDDASTIAYHTLGRNLEIKPPYSAYHSMFDKFLSLLNTNNEYYLRYTAIFFSFIFSFLSLVFLARLVNEKCNFENKNFSLFLFLIPFILPDILFSGLIINPSVISFALLLLSHLTLIKFKKTKRNSLLIISILIFGLAVSFRWSSGFYLFIFIGELFITNSKRIREIFNFSFFKKKILILFSYSISVLVFIYFSGYAINDIYLAYSGGKEYIDNMDMSYLAIFSSALAFLTPSFVILFLFGLFFIFKQKKYNILFILILGLLPFLSLGLFPSYKYLIVLIPYLIIIVAYGFSNIKGNAFKYSLLLVTFLPWIVGFQLKTNSSWGPGFEIKHKKIKNIEDYQGFNPDNYINFKNIKIVVGAGMATPTPEGPRSVYGFGKVFLNDWKKLINKIEQEREDVVDYAIVNKVDILQDVGHSLIITKLSEKGFSTDVVDYDNERYTKRVFFKNKDTVNIIIPRKKQMLLRDNFIKEVLKYKDEVLIYTSYTNLIAKLNNMYQGTFKVNGAYSGILKNYNSEK